MDGADSLELEIVGGGGGGTTPVSSGGHGLRSRSVTQLFFHVDRPARPAVVSICTVCASCGTLISEGLLPEGYLATESASSARHYW